MTTHRDFTQTLTLFFAHAGVHTRAEAELAVAVLLRAEHHRARFRVKWSHFDVDGFLGRELPEELLAAGGALILSTFLTWLGEEGILSPRCARELSDRAAGVHAPRLRPAA